jgi:acyl-CoA synthetase (AMP-forming)/AMP-acid ligase II
MHDPAFKTLDFSCCKAFVSGAAPFAPEAMQAFEALVGKNKVVELYGMTETCGVMTCNPYLGTKKIGSVGLPFPNIRIKIVDVETGARELPVGSEGEIIARGGQVNKRYFNKPEETAHALRLFNGDRWLYTGDVGKFDEDGYLYIVDRVKDMINVGGYKVFSKEVEDKMQAHPAVDMCAFIGVPNPERPGSEIVKAVIQLTPEYRGHDPQDLERDLLAYAREHMAPYKVPKLFQFIDQVPLTPVGKVDKKALRK